MYYGPIDVSPQRQALKPFLKSTSIRKTTRNARVKCLDCNQPTLLTNDQINIPSIRREETSIHICSST